MNDMQSYFTLKPTLINFVFSWSCEWGLKQLQVTQLIGQEYQVW